MNIVALCYVSPPSESICRGAAAFYRKINMASSRSLPVSAPKAMLTFQLFVVLEPKVFQKMQSPQGLRDVSGQVVLV